MQIIQEGLISLYSFYAAAILPFCIFPGISNLIKLSKLEVCCCSIILSYALVNAVFFIFTKKHLMKVLSHNTCSETYYYDELNIMSFLSGNYSSFLSRSNFLRWHLRFGLRYPTLANFWMVLFLEFTSKVAENFHILNSTVGFM